MRYFSQSLPLILGFITTCLGFSFTGDHADNCDCKPKEAYRLKAKHETSTEGYHIYSKVIDAKTIASWNKKYPWVAKEIGKKEADKTKGRLKKCPEDSIYTFDGYVYSIKTGETDCDLHLEVGPK